MNMLSDFQKTQINELFNTYLFESKNKDTKIGVWRILVDDEYFITRNNKTSWSSLSQAQLAFYHHFSVCSWYISSFLRNENISCTQSKEHFNEIYHSFLNSGRVKFIQIR